MIVHRMWLSTSRNKALYTTETTLTKEGWFLFGFIPLYISTIKIVTEKW